MEMDTILWRRVDAAGHDACRLVEKDEGWRLEGAAAFRHDDGTSACLAYELSADGQWRTQEGTIRGWVGARAFDFRITQQSPGIWTLNDQAVSHLEGCVDLDLGFTPATNLFQIRRIALQVGQGADVPVAWLDVFAGTLETLHQRYERRTVATYWYEAPRFNYSALLHVNATGFVEKYPNLWEAEP